jgi:prepilin-type N-terminal cleavage/methylation domain-containing protein
MSSSPLTSSSRGRRGFTLIELVVAMTFVALLASGIVISISTALNVWKRTAEANELNQEARAVIELLSRDLRCAYLGLDHQTGFFIGGAPQEGESPMDALYFTTQSTSAAELGLLPDDVLKDWDPQLDPPVTDLVGVRWEWHEGTADTPEGLYRVTSVMPQLEVPEDEETAVTGEVSSEFVSDAVEDLRFQYLDEGAWSTSWDSTGAAFDIAQQVGEEDTSPQVNHLPQAIAIEFVLRDPSVGENVPRGRVSKDKQHTFRTVVTLPSR